MTKHTQMNNKIKKKLLYLFFSQGIVAYHSPTHARFFPDSRNTLYTLSAITTKARRDTLRLFS